MNKLNPKSYIRPAIQLVVGVTTYAVANAVIKNNTAEPETKAQKATLAVGSYVLAQMVAAKSVQFVDARIDSVLADAQDAKAKLNTEDPK